LASSERPPVARSTAARRYGVTAPPATPSRAAAARASATARPPARAAGPPTRGGAGRRGSLRCARGRAGAGTRTAISSADSIRWGTRSPVSAVRKPGSASCGSRHGHPERLEPLERRRQVEDRLGSGADDDDRGAGELEQVGRLVANPGMSGRVGSSRCTPRSRRWRRPGIRPRSPGRATPRRWSRHPRRAPWRAPGRARSPCGRPGARGTVRAPRARGRASARPWTTALTAGTPPASRTARVMRSAASRLAGIGSPWASTELSSTTTGGRRRGRPRPRGPTDRGGRRLP
jgi:hypothetical protein